MEKQALSPKFIVSGMSLTDFLDIDLEDLNDVYESLEANLIGYDSFGENEEHTEADSIAAQLINGDCPPIEIVISKNSYDMYVPTHIKILAVAHVMELFVYVQFIREENI